MELMPEITRVYSFRGRTYLAYAHWTKVIKGVKVKNVITHYINMQTKRVKEINEDCNNYYDFDELFGERFMLIDFHEWLHLFIRRRSGLKGTYIVTPECEKFIETAQAELWGAKTWQSLPTHYDLSGLPKALNITGSFYS